ncbi:MAG TPA: hypothetical protein VFU19_21475 [Iamia sp.]|nr:hypothetical protein [Iamia sp.]
MSAPRPTPVPAVWVARALWFALPLAAGPALGAALDPRSTPVATLGTVLAWGTWAVVLVALLVPRAVSLTVVRVGAPAALVATAWAAGPGSPDDDLGRAVLAVVAAALALAATVAPPVGDAFVDGSSYGTERRFALRTPLPLLALATATWVAVAAAAVAGPFLLAARQWALGGVLTAAGAVVVWFGVRSLHGLSRRWLVLVPSGVVVHDPVGRPDSVMAPRPLIVRLGPAPAGSDGLDLTLGATGLALELETSEELPVTVREGRTLDTRPAQRVLVAVARPAAVLAEAEARRLPVA